MAALKTTGWAPNLDAYEPSLVEVRDACAEFVAAMERGCVPYWLTLIGVNGCGKSYLLRQVYAEARRINPGNPINNPIWPPNWQERTERIYTDKRPYALRFDEQEFAEKMRNGYYSLPSELRDDFFVALDELGVARDPTNFVADAITQLAENRLRGWTMWATNWSLKNITERMDARIASRLIREGNVVVTIKARDYALRGK